MIIQEIRTDLLSNRLWPSLTAALLNILITIPIAAALAALIFTGRLAPYLSVGIGFMLFAAIALHIVSIFFTSFPGVSVTIQEGPAIILAGTAVALMRTTSTPKEAFFTFMAAMIFSTLLTGLVFWGLGYFKLGNLIRYLPYPVIGGFLAGTGLLLVNGGISVMIDAPFSLLDPMPGLSMAALAHWLPGLLFAVGLMIVLRRFSHFLTIPLVIVGAILLFYLILVITNTSAAQATARGFLLGGMPGGNLWQPVGAGTLFHQVNWVALIRQSGDLLVVVIVNLIGLLLNATGLELIINRNIDLDQELKATGLSNLAAGLGGGISGFHALSISALAYRLEANSRLMGIFSAFGLLLVLLLGGSFFGYFPTLVLGGLLIFLGFDFLVEWTYETWFKLPRFDYGIIILIMLAMNTIGILEGVALGIGLATAMFVIQYSQIEVVKHAFSGRTYPNQVNRSRLQEHLLHRRDDWLYILELHGFVFFGTAHTLYERIRRRLDSPDSDPPQFIILDFRLVKGLDSSAALSFVKIHKLAQAEDIRLILTGISPKMYALLKEEVSQPDLIFPNLSDGIKWAEDQMIETFESVGLVTKGKGVIEQMTELLAEPGSAEVDFMEYLAPGQSRPPAGAISLLRQYLERREVEAGHCLIRQDEPFQGLFFIEKGEVSVQRADDTGQPVQLRKLIEGTVVGEISLYSQAAASASVVTTKPTLFYHLSLENLRAIEESQPQIALILHKFLASLMSERLETMNNTMRRLLS